MKTYIIALLSLLAIGGCRKAEPVTPPSAAGEVHAVSGRAEFVEAAQLLASPERYSGRRIILAGIWRSGFERESLDLENPQQTFGIWVELDDAKIKEKYGNLSHLVQLPPSNLVDQDGSIVSRVVAEGSFFYRRFDAKKREDGFGHMGVSEGLFLIDRILVSESVGKDQANQRLQGTPESVPSSSAGPEARRP